MGMPAQSAHVNQDRGQENWRAPQLENTETWKVLQLENSENRRVLQRENNENLKILQQSGKPVKHQEQFQEQ